MPAQLFAQKQPITSTDYAIPDAFTRVAEAVIPTVVSINSTMMIRTSEFWHNQLNDRELKNFFGEKYFNMPIPREFRQTGSGSGIIVSKQGHILTNMHVVDRAEVINVTLADNRSIKATIVGADPLTELAIIKIDSDNLPVARFGDSDSVRIGEWVLAVGNPLELQSTITAGIISAIGRDINIIADNYGVENFIQTDATINPGNSGGALVNLKGEVIGINTAIATQSGYSQGYGFAIPINLAKKIMNDLIKQGYVVRSYLGISMLDVNEKIAKALNLKQPTGIFIDHVTDDSPAQKAGVQDKDVLLKVDNKYVNKGNIVQTILAQKQPGEQILLTVIRRNKILRLPVTLGTRNEGLIKPLLSRTDLQFQNLGLIIQSISHPTAEEFASKTAEGVFVVDVEQFSPAYDAGIQANDIILEIGDKLITAEPEFYSTIAQFTSGNIYIFKMKRNENIFHCFIEIPN
jgi:serine protease Do